MSTAMIFKCPCCGGYLEFDPSLQKFKCLYCGQVLSEEDLRDQSEQREAAADAAQDEQEKSGRKAESLRSYHCAMCGAEVVTEATTAATRCYYCHSPIVLHDRLDDEFRPDGVIPFQLDKEAALAEFRRFISKKRFVDRAFFSDDQLEMFSGVYYPYWYCDVEGAGTFTGEGTRTSVRTTPRYVETTTRFFQVEREGNLSIRNIARKALEKVDGKLADGIHPFRVEDVKPYASGYLSGFLAEMRDVPESEARIDMLSEANRYADELFKTDHSFNALKGSADFKPEKVRMRYLLMPAWVLTWKGGRDGVPFYFMMNGQTGQVCGKLPVKKSKLLAWTIGVGAAVFGLLCAGGMLIW